LDEAGVLYACGGNGFQQLGLGTSGPTGTLQRVPFPAGVGAWRSIAAGNATLAIGDNGLLHGWGFLLISNLTSVGTPMPVPLPTMPQAVAAGRSHYLALGADGNLYLWGYNDAGQCGLGYADGSLITNPAVVPFPAGVTNWQTIAAGGFHTVAIGSDHRLYTWGANQYGQLGQATNTPMLASPGPVAFPPGVTRWDKLACGEYFTAALGNNGALYTWGFNYQGLLGTGSVTNELSPALVPVPAGALRWTNVTAGRNHLLALADNGSLYAWGYGSDGALGNGATTFIQNSPALVPFQPQLSIERGGPGFGNLAATTVSGRACAFQESTNLTAWISLATNRVTRGQASFSLPAAADEPSKYFRAVIVAPP
jgi:alpha-tubulin suppressor-like RCC1 family protein